MTTIFMVGCVLLGRYQMNDSEALVAVTGTVAFGFLAQFLIQLTVDLEPKMRSF